VAQPIRGSRLADAVTGLDHDAPDDRVLRRRMLEAIARVVPYEHYAFVTTDPETAVGCSPLAEVPDLAELPRLIRLKYLTEAGRWTALPEPGCSSLLRETGGDLARSAQWAAALQGHRVRDVLLAVLRDRQGTWGFLDLWRTSGQFRDDEIAAVGRALPVMTTQLRATVARAFVQVADHPRPHSDHRGPGLLLLAKDLTPVAGTPQLQEWLATLLPSVPGGSPVPASALNVGAQLLAVEGGVDLHAPLARVPLAASTWLTVRADRLTEEIPGAAIAVGYELAGPADRLEVFVRAHGLSPREREVVRAVASGLDTRAAARRLGITELTVQDHLKAVFARTGSASRAELLASALGT
jgi:DNA-binding CsgD family transcriptional regulator